MIVCRRCSRRHADGTEFCACGAYLEFEGERTDDAPPAPPPPAESSAGPETAAEGPVGSTAATVHRDAPAPWSGLSDASRPTPDDSMAILPTSGGRHRDRVDPSAPLTTGRPGDLVCPACGTPNPAGSTLCRHCAHDLAGTSRIVAGDPDQRVRRSWWRRRPPDVGRVAQRARRHRGLARRVLFMRAGGVAMAVAVLFGMLGPWGGTARSQLRGGLQLDRFDRLEQIEVDGDDVTAVLQDGTEAANVDSPYQGPERVVDGMSNTAWATRWIDPADLGDDLGDGSPGDGECVPGGTEQRLVVDFGSPVDIDRVHVLAGRSADDPTRDDFHRPRALQFSHGGECRIVMLEDTGALLAEELSFHDVTALVVEVVALHDGDTTDPTVEISELVFQQS